MNKIFFVVLSFVVFAWQGILLAEEAPKDGATGIVRTQLKETVPAFNPWKASATTAYFEMNGTQPANFNSYSFGRVHIFSESLELSYAFSPAWKVLARGKYVNNDWEVIAGGKTFAEQTTGMGDTLIGMVHPLSSGPSYKLIVDGGILLPTGSIDEANAYVPGAHYKYFLQLGSGTVDETVGLTSTASLQPVQVGSRLSTILRNGHNANGYQAGNVFRADAWGDLPLGYGLIPRIVGSYRLVRPMSGADSKINRAAAEYYYHDQVDWSVSAALKYEHPFGPGLALNAEGGVPMAQGMRNSDNVVVSIKYYANLSLAGQF